MFGLRALVGEPHLRGRFSRATLPRAGRDVSEEFHPGQFRRSLRSAKLTDAEYRVAVELAEFSMVGKPVVWPSLPLLAENCCMADRRSVRRILGRLEAKGVIECITRSKGGRSQTSHWRLCSTPETGTGGSPFTDHKTGTQTTQNRDPTCHKTGTHRSPEVVIEVEKEVGARRRPGYAGLRTPIPTLSFSKPRKPRRCASHRNLA
jgi:hypothetical protein